MGGQENNSTESWRFVYGGTSTLTWKKPLSQVLGQWWFHHTNCQLTGKVSGHLFPNWYQENHLLMKHLFVYGNIFVMILCTVPQSHPFPLPASQLSSWQEAFMGTKMYSGFQNILFTTPWNMSPKASRFYFELYVSLQDWSPPNQVFHENICNCLYLYQMKSDSKIIELCYTTRRTSDDSFEFFEFVPKMFLSCCYFARYATKCNMTTKHIEKSCECR